MIKRALAGLAALSLAASPAVAQSAASALSVSAQASASAAETEGGTPIIPPILAGAVVVFGILLATETWPFDEDDDEPVSP